MQVVEFLVGSIYPPLSFCTIGHLKGTVFLYKNSSGFFFGEYQPSRQAKPFAGKCTNGISAGST